jgi:defect-in-organelle-trafficking protein DotD
MTTHQLENQLKDFSQYFMYQNQKMKLPDRLSLETADKILARELFIDWSGPAHVLLDELAQMSGYKFRAIGHLPVVPALVTLHHQRIALIDVISDVSLQIHHNADIAIFPEQKVIELRYKG